MNKYFGNNPSAHNKQGRYLRTDAVILSQENVHRKLNLINMNVVFNSLRSS